jgi:hypothetical protein
MEMIAETTPNSSNCGSFDVHQVAVGEDRRIEGGRRMRNERTHASAVVPNFPLNYDD